MREVVVLGVGMHKFGRFLDKSLAQIGLEACLDALKDANLEWRDIPVAYCGHVFQGVTAGQRVCGELGHSGIPIINVENACASGSTALRLAHQSVAAGFYDIALAFGIEKMSRGMIDVSDREGFLGQAGLQALPSKYAMMARKHMKEYGLTLRQLALVSVKNHKHGCYNPYSQYQKEFTVEEIMDSRMICDPLTLLQCCPTGDGAAAAILCSEDVAKRYSRGPFVKIAASALSSQVYDRGEADGIAQITVKTGKDAYEMAGCGPGDLDLVELHDCFTMAEISHCESLGLCQKGEGGRLVEEGVTELGGRIPVNPSGGLLAKGHPLGATGVAQIVELVWQLRGQASQRQVEDAKIGLAHTMGGGSGIACSVTILKR